MYRALTIMSLIATTPLLGGCLAKAAVDAATLPVKAASKGYDMATTSQSEADEKRGRKLRKREEELGKLSRDRDKQARKCDRGDRDACEKARQIGYEIERLQYEPI